MIAVIFEVRPREGGLETYLDMAAQLRPQLDQVDGFISVERFESLSAPGTYLSLSFWRDEKAIKQWRNLESHRRAQAAGRAGLFDDYRLRIAQVIRDYGLENRAEAPTDSRSIHIEQRS
jgi:heme-degrading monooxygenase HmoA